MLQRRWDFTLIWYWDNFQTYKEDKQIIFTKLGNGSNCDLKRGSKYSCHHSAVSNIWNLFYKNNVICLKNDFKKAPSGRRKVKVMKERNRDPSIEEFTYSISRKDLADIKHILH